MSYEKRQHSVLTDTTFWQLLQAAQHEEPSMKFVVCTWKQFSHRELDSSSDGVWYTCMDPWWRRGAMPVRNFRLPGGCCTSPAKIWESCACSPGSAEVGASASTPALPALQCGSQDASNTAWAMQLYSLKKRYRERHLQSISFSNSSSSSLPYSSFPQ